MNTIRRHIVFKGEVQGVGFRWRARNAAEAAGCTGWVRNEWDGSVTMEIQGTKYQIEYVIDKLKNGSFIEIDSMTSLPVPVIEGERSFSYQW